MSRSYRKNCIIKQGDKSLKKTFNRSIRRKLKNPDYELSDGGAYKKVPSYGRWELFDWIYHNELIDVMSWYPEAKVIGKKLMCVYKYKTRMKIVFMHKDPEIVDFNDPRLKLKGMDRINAGIFSFERVKIDIPQSEWYYSYYTVKIQPSWKQLDDKEKKRCYDMWKRCYKCK